MSPFRTLATALATSLTAGGALVVTAPSASASDPLDGTGDTAYATSTTGHCSGRSSYQVSVAGSTVTDVLQVTATVDGTRAGQKVSWQLLHNGVRFASGTATTGDPSGDFTVRRRTNDVLGADTLRLLTTDLRTGETCDGVVLTA